MNLALWIVAGLLALVALVGGITKTFLPKATLAATSGGSWTAPVPAGLVKALGLAELAAAAGLILPAALGIAPIMVPVTAVCWVLLMIGATLTHYRQGEPNLVAVNVIYLALAVFVAWGRCGVEAFIN